MDRAGAVGLLGRLELRSQSLEAVGRIGTLLTGQRLDGTGLLYYHARMYDPLLGRFVSGDSVVPGSASGAGGGAATLGVDGSSQLAPLTVDFHEPGFVAAVNGENAFRAERGFWFQLSDDDKQQAKSPWGPANPQALNRYAYVLNNPLRYVDPSGHNRVSATFRGHSYGYQEVRDTHGDIITDTQGRTLWEIWSCETGDSARCTVMWVFENQEFRNYKAAVDAMASVDYAGSLISSGVAGAGALACLDTVIGCVAIVPAVGYAYYRYRQSYNALMRYSGAAGGAMGRIGYGGQDHRGSAVYKCVLISSDKCHPGDYGDSEL